MSHFVACETLLAGESSPKPTAAERLASVEADLEKIQELLEHLWVQRNMLYAAIRELKTVKRDVELVKAGLVGGAP